MKTNDLAVAAGHSVDPARWQEAFEVLMSRIAVRFARVEPRRRVRDLVLGLLSDLPRKNCWSIAEWAGQATPDGMQHLLGRARWDADDVRDDVREYVLEHLHDEDAVLVVDETGDVKKGTHTVGVQRQYTGTAGRIENSQVAVYLVYAGLRGHAAVDRELYVPRSWTCDPHRCRAAGLGEDTVLATKPELAARMIGRFSTPGTAWAGSQATRSTAATRSCEPRWKSARSATCSPSPAHMKSPPVQGSSARMPWPRRCPSGPGRSCRPGLVPRGTASTTGLSSTWRNPAPVPLAALVRVAGSRWRVEETFQSGKGLAGLDEHQVRRYISWSRWVTLAMLAHAFLAAMAAHAATQRGAAETDQPSSPSLWQKSAGCWQLAAPGPVTTTGIAPVMP
ncbi:transposase [Streptomyces noursei]|nr:transposase [Streptomyces noursei]